MMHTVFITLRLEENKQITCYYFEDIIRLTINMDSGEHLMHPLHFLKGCPTRGKGDWAYPGIFSVEWSCATTEEDGFIVTRCSNKYCRCFLQVFGPFFKEILNILFRDFSVV